MRTHRRFEDPAEVEVAHLRADIDSLTRKLNNTTHTTWYVMGVLITSVLGVLAVIALTLIRPTSDNTSLIATIFGALMPITTALLALLARDVQKNVNGRLSQLIAAERAAHRASGMLEGVEVERGRAIEEVSKIAEVAVRPADIESRFESLLTKVEGLASAIQEHDDWEREELDVKKKIIQAALKPEVQEQIDAIETTTERIDATVNPSKKGR